AKRKLHLIIGSEIGLACGTRLVFLATNLNGYGNLSELITLGRRRADKGSYLLHRRDLDVASADNPARATTEPGFAHLAGLPDCIALLIPQRNASTATLAEQADWLARTFADRAR